ncbi:hypothetical protein B6U71_04835 [Euryarchaeota archaeon ex4484_178]|nr:MAG: hypothetical protein B6U71_04835 [Euryarchaeota archaeon ex4484_178]
MFTLLHGKKRYLAKKNGMYKVEDFGVVKDLKEGKIKLGTEEFFVLRSNLYDYFETLKRKAQIITLKDAAYIIARCGIHSGMRVVEGGAGSGAMSTALLLEACEIIKRNMVIGEGGTRPDNIEVAHTGYIVFGRKI